jgi:small subunit ribosomal protein S18
LKQFLDNYARIGKNRRTGLCALHQRGLAQAVKRARELALIPYSAS